MHTSLFCVSPELTTGENVRSSSEDLCGLIPDCQNKGLVEVLSRTPNARGNLHVELEKLFRIPPGLTTTSKIRGVVDESPDLMCEQRLKVRSTSRTASTLTQTVS